MNLIESVKTGNLEKCKQLIENERSELGAKRPGADVNYQDDRGHTALIWASVNRNLPIVKLLIEATADVNQKRYGWNSPLHFASSRNNLSNVKLLIKSQSDVNYRNGYGSTALEGCLIYSPLIKNGSLIYSSEFLIFKIKKHKIKSLLKIIISYF